MPGTRNSETIMQNMSDTFFTILFREEKHLTMNDEAKFITTKSRMRISLKIVFFIFGFNLF